MIKNDLNKLLMEAIKSRDNIRMDSLRALKTAIINYETSKNAKEYTDAVEISIIKKLVEQREESVDMYKNAGRDDLADIEQGQANVLKEFLPKPVTNEDIETTFNELALNIEPIKKNLGLFIKGIKEKLPMADGKIVSQIVMSNIQS